MPSRVWAVVPRTERVTKAHNKNPVMRNPRSLPIKVIISRLIFAVAVRMAWTLGGFPTAPSAGGESLA